MYFIAQFRYLLHWLNVIPIVASIKFQSREVNMKKHEVPAALCKIIAINPKCKILLHSFTEES